jgi:hypothetical protein
MTVEKCQNRPTVPFVPGDGANQFAGGTFTRRSVAPFTGHCFAN